MKIKLFFKNTTSGSSAGVYVNKKGKGHNATWMRPAGLRSPVVGVFASLPECQNSQFGAVDSRIQVTFSELCAVPRWRSAVGCHLLPGSGGLPASHESIVQMSCH